MDEATAAIRRERTKIYIEQIQFLEQFQITFRGLVEEHVRPNRFAVFVDDLDRCLPEKAIQVLEAIKLFLDVKDCVFVLGLDQEVIARGIEMKYKEFGEKRDGDNQQHFMIEGIRYLEKIIQLPFQIPPVEKTDMGEFVQGLSAEWPHEECPKVFAEGLGNNPRQIKRTVNAFLMLWKLAQRHETKLQGRIKPIRLAKVIAIQAIYPELYNIMKETPRYLRDLEDYYSTELSSVNKDSEEIGVLTGLEALIAAKRVLDDAADSEIRLHVEPPPALASFIFRPGVRRILTMHSPEIPDANFGSLSSNELRLYFTLTRRAESPVTTFGKPLAFSEPQMVRIPAGKFLMGSTDEQVTRAINNGAEKKWVACEQPPHNIELSEYSIGKYPITNHEYQAFVRDTKHNSPRGWEGDQFPIDKGGHPVVNVSWNDAIAYCKWLTKKSGKQYRLPTEAEWEKAARSEDGRVYPWGNDFDPKKANTDEAKIGDASDVGMFSPQGDSFYGCADMIGNVWEWCNDWFNENEYKNRENASAQDPQGPQHGKSRVLRGGSFISNSVKARCARRIWYNPTYLDRDWGFRVASSPDIEESGN